MHPLQHNFQRINLIITRRNLILLRRIQHNLPLCPLQLAAIAPSL